MSKKLVIVPLSKSNWAEGRVGPARLQDGHRSIVRAGKYLFYHPHATILLMSATVFMPKTGEPVSELECMEDSARIAGIALAKTEKRAEGTCTYTQVQILLDHAVKRGWNLHLIATQLHFFRVWWIVKRFIKADPEKYKDIEISYSWVLWCIPRPKEFITDAVLMFLYPLLDLLGHSQWFREFTSKRREKGKL